MSVHRKPTAALKSIFFYPNRMVAVCDERGEQVPRYQGEQKDALAAMEADGVDWKEIPERYGEPKL